MVSVWLKKKRELVPVKNLNFRKNKVTYKYKGKKITSSYGKDDSDVELVYTTGLVGTQWETINLDFDVVKLSVYHGAEEGQSIVAPSGYDVMDPKPSKLIEFVGVLTMHSFMLYVDDFALVNLDIADSYKVEVLGNKYEFEKLTK